MPESFGARLRQRRERQHIALTAIAEQTKIKLSLLESLERDDVSRWPSGIFRRSFVRAYAHAIALPPDEVVREFVERFPDPLEDPATATFEAVADAASDSGGPPTRFRYFVGAAVARFRPAIGQKPIAHVVEPAHAYADLPDVPDMPQVAVAVANVAPAVEVREALEIPVTFATPETPETPETSEIPETRVAAEIPEPPEIPVTVRAVEPDLSAAAYLCTELGRLDETRNAAPLLEEAARILDAVGLIVWVWHQQASELRPALAQGYSDTVLAQLPRVRRDTDNATAAAFRSAQTCVVSGGDLASGALAVPLMTPVGCTGVLAIELQDGREQRESVRAVATIVAAQLARVIGTARAAEVADRRLA